MKMNLSKIFVVDLSNRERLLVIHKWIIVDPGGPVVIILATGSEVRGFKPGRSRWIFSELKSPEYDFLRKGSKAVGPVSWIYGT